MNIYKNKTMLSLQLYQRKCVYIVKSHISFKFSNIIIKMIRPEDQFLIFNKLYVQLSD